MRLSLWSSRVSLFCLFGTQLCACASLVSDGKVGEREVRLDGTGFAWLDETVYVASSEGTDLKERDSDDVTLHFVFTSAVFDPTVDLRTLSVAERQRVEDDIARGDLLRLQIRRGDRLVAGDAFEYSTMETPVPGAGPYLSRVQLVLGAPVLEKDAEYPERIEAPARELEVDVELNGVEPRLLGVVDVAVRQGEDGLGAEGDITVRFDVDRVSERVAECNFAPEGTGAGLDPCGQLSLSQE